MALSPSQRRELKAKAHALNPVIIIGGKGLTDSVVLETDRALEAHELIKVRVNADDKPARKVMAEELCSRCQAELIQTIGHIAVIYRKRLGEK
jgi:RNA-binding protein